MTAPEDHPTWGGKRSKQTGRPPLRKGLKRVHLHCTIDSATKAKLKAKAKKEAKSVGLVIDDLVKRN